MRMRSRWLAWPTRSLWVWIVIGAATTVLGTAASADVLCKRRSGGVVVRSPECKKKEIPLDPATLGLQGPQGPPGQPGAAGSGGYAVVDSEGSKVGMVAGVPEGFGNFIDGASAMGVVQNTVEGRLLTFGASLKYLGGQSGPPEVMYASPDCSGQAYVYAGRPVIPVYTPGASVLDGPTATTGYHAGAPIQRVTIRSNARSDPDGSLCISCNTFLGTATSVGSRVPEDSNPWCCCSFSPQFVADEDVGPLTTLDLSGFVPPFRVQ